MLVLETFLRCQILFWATRGATRKRATIAQAIGTAVAAGAEMDNRAKILGEPAPRIATIVERSVATYEDIAKTSEMPEPEIAVLGSKQDVANAAMRYATAVSPRVRNVLSAEESIVAEVAEGIQLAGSPDVVTETEVRDLKTGQPWTPERAHRRRQLTAYTLLWEAKTGKAPTRVAIDSLYRKGSRWQAETFFSRRTEEDRRVFLKVLTRARDAIQAGSCLPAPEGAWWCSRKWCPHWDECEAISRR